MLGLSIDKLLVVAIAAAIIIGPARLPGYAKRLGEIVRGLRAFLDDARARAEAETGLTKEDWASMDPRRYDPRRIVREALAEPEATAVSASSPDLGSAAGEPSVPSSDSLDEAPVGGVVDGPRDRPDGIQDVADRPLPSAPSSRRYIVTGSSAHPRRVLVPHAPPPDAAEGESPTSLSASGAARP